MPNPDDLTATARATDGSWLSTSEAAAALKLSERTIQRRAKVGKITARKIMTGDGEKWEVQLSADSDAKEVPTGADEREVVSAAPQIGDSADRVPTEGDDSADTSETVFLRAQLGAMNEALKREQLAHEQTRQLLAGALQMASRQLPNATPQRSQNETPDNAVTSSSDAVKSPPARAPRPLWKVMFGIR